MEQQQESNHPQAGTSSTHQNQINPKTLIFPPLQQGHLPSAAISGSNDLLSLFNLTSLYDSYVKPYHKTTDLNNPPITNQPIGLNGDVKGKGKGKADLSSLGAPSPAQLDNLAHKQIKMEKSYGHFVADVGGRNSIKKDHQIESWITDPNFHESQVQDFLKPFSNEVLSNSFTLKPGILEGFDSSIWVAEEGGPKRKRRKRKQGEMLAGGAGGMNQTGPLQGTTPQQQVHPQQQQLNLTNQRQVHPNSLMMSNLQSTTPTMKNQQIGMKSHRNAPLPDSNHLINHHRIATPPTSNLPQSLAYPNPHSSNDAFFVHEDHRKKKRTKISNNSTNNNNNNNNNPNNPSRTSGSNSGSSNHRLALQS